MNAQTETAQAPHGTNGFEPKIIAFVCNWCTYLGADLAGTNRLEYPPNVRMIRLPCTGRIDFNLVIKAFEVGADAVLVSGCHPGDCHYTAGNYHARRRWMLFRPLLEALGFDLRRLHFTWISAAEGKKFQQVITEITEETRGLGPYRYPVQPETRQLEIVGAAPPPPAGIHPENVEHIRQQARELLSSGKVNVVVGYADQGRPLFVTTPEEAGQLALNEHCRMNLAVYLKRKEVKALGQVAIVVSPTGRRTLNVLEQENQLNRDSLVEIAAEGISPPEEAAELEALLRLGPEERMAWWAGEFDRCTKCYACRQACPLCYCERCIADKNRPQAIDTSAHAKGNFAWHITRAFHLAGRCTGCGNCTDACPSGVPLKLLNLAASLAVMAQFDYRPGEDPSAEPIPGAFSLQDKEDFIH